MTFSILIAALNEGLNIKGLVESLKALKYPEDKYEIIIVDDNSIDDTSSLLMKAEKEINNLKIITASNKRFNGKKGALDLALSESKNEIIAFTDADCIVPPDWLNLLSKIIENGCDLTFGLAPFIQKISLTNKLSCWENLRTHVLTFTSAKLGIPYSGTSRNLAFRKSFFSNLGIFEKYKSTLSGDDDFTIKEFYTAGYNIKANPNPKSAVFSSSKERFKDYLNQKARHTSTSTSYSFKIKLLLFMWHTINILLVFSPLLSFYSIWWLLPIVIKIIFDLVVTFRWEKLLNYKFNIFEKIYLQIIYELLLIFHFIRSFKFKSKWS